MSSNCPTCNKEYKNLTAVKIHHTKTHGKSIAGFEYDCAWCGNTVIKNNTTYEKAFCSNSCRDNWQSDNWSGENNPNFKDSIRELTCNYCGDTFKRYPSQAKNGRGKFCSMSCSQKDKSGENAPNYQQVECVCQECGESFSVRKYRKDDARFCSYSCHYDYMDEGASVYYGDMWDEVADEMREKADNKCQICGTEGEKKLPVHHIIRVREFDNPNDAHFEENLVVLCQSHHMKMEFRPFEEQCERLNKYPAKVEV